jgi:hypothetical protein
MNLDLQNNDMVDVEEIKPCDSDGEETPDYDGGNVCAKCHHPLKISFLIPQNVKSKGKPVTKHDRLVRSVVSSIRKRCPKCDDAESCYLRNRDPEKWLK